MLSSVARSTAYLFQNFGLTSVANAIKPAEEVANTTTYPTASTADLATLSRLVYQDGSTQIPDGWEWFMDYEGDETSFFSSCYIKRTPTPIIVFAVRGTVISEWHDVLDDLELYLKKIPDLLTEANTFFATVLDKLTNEFGSQLPQIPRYFTGHSLGAALAQLAYASCEDASGLCKSVVFENPGTFDIVSRVLKKTWKGTSEDLQKLLSELSVYASNYQAHPNAINTCHKQWGTTYELSQLPYAYVVPNSPLPTDDFSHIYGGDDYWLLTYTKYQHELGPICDYLYNNNELTCPISRPDTIEKGYLAYLDYESNKLYWVEDENSGYFAAAWNANIQYQNQYLNFDQFLQEGIKRLAKAQSSWLERISPYVTHVEEDLTHKIEEIEEVVQDFVFIPRP